MQRECELSLLSARLVIYLLKLRVLYYDCHNIRSCGACVVAM